MSKFCIQIGITKTLASIKYFQKLCKRGSRSKKYQAHNLTQANFEDLPFYLNDPIAVLASETNNKAVVVLTELINKNGDSIIAAIYFNVFIQRKKATVIVSVYCKSYSTYARMLISSGIIGKLHFINEPKIKKWLRNKGKLQLLTVTGVDLHCYLRHFPW